MSKMTKLSIRPDDVYRITTTAYGHNLNVAAFNLTQLAGTNSDKARAIVVKVLELVAECEELRQSGQVGMLYERHVDEEESAGADGLHFHSIGSKEL